MSSTIEARRADRVPMQEEVAKPSADLSEDLPLTLIERRSSWQLVDWRELWRHHELLFFLTWRDVKVRYKQTVLGVAWAVVQPLATMLVFAMFLGRMGNISQEIEHYALFVFAGMLPWTFFANALTSSGNSVVGNQTLITKVYFPRLIVPLSTVGAGLVDFAIAFVMLLVMMPFNEVYPGWRFLLLPFIVLLLVVAAFGIGTLLAALTVAYRDFRYVLPFGVQLWMFSTPCIYLDATKVVGPHGQLLLPLNPVYGLILNFRQAVMNGPLDFYALGVSAAVSVALLVVGCLYFRRVERGFADII